MIGRKSTTFNGVLKEQGYCQKNIFVHRYVTRAAERDAKLGVGEGVKCLLAMI